MPNATASRALTYSSVNDALNAVFFDGRFKLSPLYLDIEADVAVELGARLSMDAESALNAVASVVARTLVWQPGLNPYSWHLSELKAWNDLFRFEPPPFTALLCVFALAAERMRGDENYSAHNYYERLFEVLAIEDETRKNRVRQAAQTTKQFWESLNAWLTENDFDVGRPTARSVNGWEYAGYALSQALVRKADRQKLHSCFIEYGLAPFERLTDAEMTQYLHDWMRGPQPSAWLKRIWAIPDLRSRVAAAACAELESWAGAEGAKGEELQRRRLSWAAALQTFPSPGLRMFLSAAGEEDTSVSGLRLADGASAAGKAAFRDCASGLWLSASEHGGISVLEPVREIALSPLMLASFQLRAPDAGLKYERAARSVVPLVKLDTGAYFREVSRASFLRPHMVLCHVEWQVRVERLLKSTARPGFRKWSADQLKGLPQDWALFSGVEILRHAEVRDDNLAALTPLAEGVSIEMSGGLRLSQGLFHSSAAPEITASATDGTLRLKLVAPDGKVLRDRCLDGPFCRLTLSDESDWGQVNLTLQALVNGRVRSETQIAFRSAKAPKRLSKETTERAYFLSDEDGGAALSASAPAQAGITSVTGMCVLTPAAALPKSLLGTEPISADLSGEEERPIDADGDYLLHRIDGLQETCILRGYHHWLVEAFHKGDDPHAPIWKTCKDCSQRVLTPANRGRHASSPQKKAGPAVKVGAAPPKMNARKQAEVSPAQTYDALGYLGTGSWQRFQDVVSGSAENEILPAHEWASNLLALGLLDLSFEKSLRTPSAWVVPPPALVFTPAGTAFLAGFRSATLVASIKDRLFSAGASLSEIERDHAPPALIFSGLEKAQGAKALSGLVDAHSRPVVITSDVAIQISAVHPGFLALERCMRAIRIEDAPELPRFDLGSGRWRSVERIEPGGAYRADYAGRRYFYVKSDGEMREGPHWLVKIAAARARKLRLHGFDSSNGAFQSVLGSDLPPLLQRALSACSGLLPRKAAGKAIYEGVPREVAAAIITKLYA